MGLIIGLCFYILGILGTGIIILTIFWRLLRHDQMTRKIWLTLSAFVLMIVVTLFLDGSFINSVTSSMPY
ncbi:hypothetical protein WR164_01970 [Philodulcilactobacillus myokoensis]|uniref:Uncharacterized protein n=1 Tax=Philodulcilactobacillus myokoensis TaxID=2929573 RepID=A0A9W6B035_9LACO|nr:hypothetical protein [Philodulcilactobacillus myokoensis]GLB46218.1 hypothetical protein WR164_01970 [Philodulcilactobacillus myokoensis]